MSNPQSKRKSVNPDYGYQTNYPKLSPFQKTGMTTAKVSPKGDKPLIPISEEEPLMVMPTPIQKVNTPKKVDAAVGGAGRQVIINIRISNHGLHPSQKKHSMIALQG